MGCFSKLILSFFLLLVTFITLIILIIINAKFKDDISPDMIILSCFNLLSLLILIHLLFIIKNNHSCKIPCFPLITFSRNKPNEKFVESLV